jgi:predicted ATPase/class 3 adenylate cyclase
MGDPSRPDLPMGTVTFLFSDIEGSTQLASELEPATYRELLEQHNRLLRAAFDARAGVERGTQGDAFLVIFREAPSAVGAAVDAQHGLAAASWPNGIDVRVRMGIHSGAGIPGGDDYVGSDINRAARITGAAHGGQVLLSDATRALAERDLPVGTTIRDLGRHRLKDLAHAEHLFQLVVDGLRSEFPPLRTIDSRPNNLTARLTSFVGRVKEIEELQLLVAENRLVSLTGPGGVGKTSLATELARQALDAFPDGAWFVGLESIIDPGLVASAIVTALGIREGGNRLPTQLLRDHLRDRTQLLVLDNFERVLGAAELVRALLQEAPGLKVVVTTRAPLHISGEQEYAVTPLPLPLHEPGDLGTSDFLAALETVDSVRLFIDRARRAQAAFTMTPETAGSVVETCRRLDGLPLGIELAAARVGLLTPGTIAERLARRLPLPGSAARDLPDRQRTVRETIDWSYELLDPPTQRLFASLSVFAGDWDLGAAESVCGPAGEIGIGVLDGIAHLVDQSLVRALTTGPATRFTMLQTIRDFAADRLQELGQTADLGRRHAVHFLALSESAAVHLPGRDQVAWLARLTEERDNIRAAISWTIDASDAESGLRFSAALWRYWHLGGHVAEGRATVKVVLSVPGAERPSRARLRALEAAGGLLYWSGESGRAGGMYKAQLALARELRDTAGEADALFNLAATTSQWGDMAGAFAMAGEARRLYQELGDRRGQARVDVLKGIGTMIAGDTRVAREMMARAAVQCRELDDVYFEALTLGTLSWASFIIGDTRGGLPQWRQAMELDRALGDLASTTIGLEFVAIVAAEVGLLEEAARIRAAFEALCRTYAVRPPRPLEQILSRPDYAVRIFASLGEERYETAAERGRKMTLDEAVDYAFSVSREIETRVA